MPIQDPNFDLRKYAAENAAELRRQFWIMLAVTAVSSVGSTFLLLYLQEKMKNKKKR